MESEFKFDEQPGGDNTIKMGESAEVVEKSGEELAAEAKQADVETDKFKKFVGDNPYIVFDKAGLSHFIELMMYHIRLGYDSYTTSFKVDTSQLEETGKVSLVYNNGNILAMSDVEVEYSGESGVVSSQIIDVKSFARMYSASIGRVFLYQDESDLYSFVFGGRAYVQTIVVEKDICSREHLVGQLSSKAKSEHMVDESFIHSLRKLYDVVRTGTRADEKAIYFKKDYTYIYSGIVMGRFPGHGLDLTVQDLDISSLARMFFDINGQLSIEDHDLFMRYSWGDRVIYLGKRSLELADDMAFKPYDTPNYATVNIDRFKNIVDFLISMPENEETLVVEPFERGVQLVSYQKQSETTSVFKLPGTIGGSGVEKVHLQLGVLKTFLALFGTQVILKNNDNKLYFEEKGVGEIIVYGNI